MAQKGRPLKEFGYRKVEILKSETLGVGSYGVVYKAKCDDLPCAAKMFHLTLFDPRAQEREVGEKEHRIPFVRFQQECEFLKAIRHPNIVQYLGSVQDSETLLPVLLMELMDYSLTHFLESSLSPIPYHIQVNFCHDISLALAFLHCNSIIHRDLSANNVLLIGDVRAKVSDFGMAKLEALSSQTPQGSYTKCPGANVYMPPEALRANPVYTEKIDSFSFGVIVVQVLTRKFPKPGDRLKTVKTIDPHFPTVQVPVSEIERRTNHISEIDPDHPLLPVALDCLIDNDLKRPSAQQLCSRLAALKVTERYVASVRNKDEHIKNLEEHLDDYHQQINSLHRELEQLQKDSQKRIEAHSAYMKDQEVQCTPQIQEVKEDEQVKNLKEQLDDYRQQINNLHQELEQHEKDCQKRIEAQSSCTKEVQCTQQIQEAKEIVQVKEKENHKLRELLKLKDWEIQTLTSKLQKPIEKKTVRFEEPQNQTQTQTASEPTHNVHSQLQTQVNTPQQAKDTPQQAKESLEPTRSGVPQWIQSLRPRRHVKREASKFPPSANISQTLPTKGKKKSRRKSIQASLEFIWRRGKKAPRRMYGTKYAVSKNTAYFMLYSDIYAYEWKSDSWSQLPACPNILCSLAVVCGLPTAIGGQAPGNGDCTNKLLSLVDDDKITFKWKEVFPHMPTKRDSSVAVCADKTLIVAGGTMGGVAGDVGRVLRTVEVMNTITFQWHKVAELPCPLYDSSSVICGDCIFVIGGWDSNSTAVSQVHTCSLTALLKSTSSSQPSSNPSPSIWSQVADVPVQMCPCISVQNRLIIVGGKDSSDKPTKAVHMYNEAADSWEVVSYISSARHGCLAVVFSDSVLMVVGGLTSVVTDSVEFATVI